jgi:pimeloyl-ACP methyl ester carboxylesterase
MTAIDAEPIAVGDRQLGPGEADLGVVAPLYSGEDGWEVLAAALEDAAAGDGAALLGLSDAYTRREASGSYTNEQEAFYATGCIDGSAVGDDLPALADRVDDVAPRIGPTAVWLGMPCRFWPAPPVGDPTPIRAAGAPPILVVGTTRDPVTPYPWAQSLADQLESGALLTFDGTGHGSLGRNACVDDAVAAYLVDLAVPDDGARCDA